MISSKFKTLFKKLNPEQLSAVNDIEGPVMVIAGPGTGKTQILTLRIANILARTDANPENILALTFTESATANMRRRLAEIIGPAAYYVNIATFHGFCNQLIKDYPENFPQIIGSKNINAADQIALARKIVTALPLKDLKPFGDKFYYVMEILSAVKKIKNEGFDPKTFPKILPKKTGDKTAARRKELAAIYDCYQKELSKRRLYDFDDMVLGAVSALQKNKNFLLDLQEKYRYILIDEHQDTNGAQNKTLELLAGYDKSPNLFAVGDDQQAIFRFQGASLENFLYFKKKYPRAKLIELKNNYRSTQKILDASASLIRHNTETLNSGALKAQTESAGQKIIVAALAGPEEEYLFIAKKIKKLIKDGAPRCELAVLYRDNKDAPPLADVLERQGIPLTIESDENILADPAIKKLHTLLAAIDNFPSPEHLAPALHLDFLELDPLEIYEFILDLGRQPQTPPSRLSLDGADGARAVVKKIGEWKKLNYNQSFPKFFETVINDSGFLKNLLSRNDYHQSIDRLNILFKEIKKLTAENADYRLSDYLGHLAMLKEHNLPLQTKTALKPHTVRLMTAHRAKGLEFETVFIAGASHGHWDNKRRADYFKLDELIARAGKTDKNEDERRLFYMALTRAKKNAFITYSRLSAAGREQTPSQFISEIQPNLKEEIHGGEISPEANVFLAASQPLAPFSEKNFIKNLFLKRGLSPTTLSNYLACPWKFFYQNLLRIPKTVNRWQIYGLAKHAALRNFFENKNKTIKLLTGGFAKDLARHPLNSDDLETIKAKGTATLKAYYDFYKNSWHPRNLNEFVIKGIDFTLTKNQKIRLAGRLDKLEFKPNSPLVTVVDYKTKPPQSRNWILGQTKNSNGDYFRQLVFYKLLLDLLPRKKYKMELGTIDFTEPCFAKASRGRPANRVQFKKETFEITPADLSDLKNLIAQTADEILNLKFWDKRCGQKDCEYCALRKLLPKSDVV